MKVKEVLYTDGPVNIVLQEKFSEISSFHDKSRIVVITDENIFRLHKDKFAGYPVIPLPAGEVHKTQATVDRIIDQLLELNADKSWMIAGAGGGVVTDIAGFVASIYKRGVKLALVPTTLLGMTDAALGGKNGVNAGIYKNMVGTVYRPQFILYDFDFLDTLPAEEWANGFAEIIKHACIRDAEMFNELEQSSPEHYMNNKDAITALVEKNIDIKNAVVVNDEYETGERYLLNFGHTFGHAIENIYGLSHGNAVSVGMMLAAHVSELTAGFDKAATKRLSALLEKYHLPVAAVTDADKIFSSIEKDKKRSGDYINFVVLNKTGEGAVKPLKIDELRKIYENM